MKPAPSLKALAETKTEGISKVTTFRVDPTLVTFEENFNLRDYESDELKMHIDRLYEAMKQGAFIPPIDVRVENGIIIGVEGHCRTLAACRLKKEIPDFTLEARQFRGNEQERTLHMLGTGSGQKALSPLEQGIGFLRLIRFGLKSSEIAAKLGVSRVTIDNGLTLAEAPVEVQDMIRAGEVSSTMAREVVKQGADAVEALKTAVKAEAGGTKKEKKVTAKKLRGTKAQKVKPVSGIPVDEIAVTMKKDQAIAVAAFIRSRATASVVIEFAATLEMLLM